MYGVSNSFKIWTGDVVLLTVRCQTPKQTWKRRRLEQLFLRSDSKVRTCVFCTNGPTMTPTCEARHPLGG
ncbi:hypothetical protein TNCV_3103231 [Trichonephila clavipes]|nr:hypothetical protein TNCV_3103231 [Trichonephila clavipes]